MAFPKIFKVRTSHFSRRKQKNFDEKADSTSILLVFIIGSCSRTSWRVPRDRSSGCEVKKSYEKNSFLVRKCVKNWPRDDFTKRKLKKSDESVSNCFARTLKNERSQGKILTELREKFNCQINQLRILKRLSN